MNRRKIAILTGTRAEYGLLHSLLERLKLDPEVELQLIVTGSHLSPEFGLTYRQIENDGFTIDAKVEMLLSADTPSAVCKSMGLATIGFAEAFDRLKPDMLVLLGDRYEILAAAQTALIFRIPIAHIHGGEVTEGAFDESIRHAITKMSSIHFVAAHEFRDRVIQMGESPLYVFVSGAPGVDKINSIPLYSREELMQELDFKLAERNFMVSFHPETRAAAGSENSMSAIFEALDRYPGSKAIIVYPNADTDGRKLINEIEEYATSHNDRVLVAKSLDSKTYLSVMNQADVLIGNSSSFVIEAPSLKTPAVLLGDRQKGRPCADSILPCSLDVESICERIEEALAPEFVDKLVTMENPYGQGDAVAIIAERLKLVDLSKLCAKPFFDISHKH